MKTQNVLIVLILISVLLCSITQADFIFTEPSKVPNINTSSADGCGSISSDGLELYIASFHPYGGDECHSDIYVATRSTVEDTWSTPIKLGPPVNTDRPENCPCISADGLELYFNDGWTPFLISGCTHRPGGYGMGDLWVSTRMSKDDSWSEPVNLGPNVNSSYREAGPSISSDGLSLYFQSFERAGGFGFIDLYVTKRLTKNDPWGPAENLGPPINTGSYEQEVFISPDNLSLYFSRGRFIGSKYRYTIYVSQRSSDTSPWETPMPFEPVNVPNSEYRLTFTPGCSTLYFNCSDDWNPWNSNTFPTTVTSYDIWQVEATPKVDLNEDGIVDAIDVCIMVEHWHTYDSLCDIAPAPLGDGFIDIQDLTVLAEHLFEEVPAP